jgi:hypothetical protein
VEAGVVELDGLMQPVELGFGIAVFLLLFALRGHVVAVELFFADDADGVLPIVG